MSVYLNDKQCGEGFKKEDVIVLNGTEEDVSRQRAAMEERKLRAKQAKVGCLSLLAGRLNYHIVSCLSREREKQSHHLTSLNQAHQRRGKVPQRRRN